MSVVSVGGSLHATQLPLGQCRSPARWLARRPSEGGGAPSSSSCNCRFQQLAVPRTAGYRERLGCCLLLHLLHPLHLLALLSPPPPHVLLSPSLALPPLPAMRRRRGRRWWNDPLRRKVGKSRMQECLGNEPWRSMRFQGRLCLAPPPPLPGHARVIFVMTLPPPPPPLLPPTHCACEPSQGDGWKGGGGSGCGWGWGGGLVGVGGS